MLNPIEQIDAEIVDQVLCPISGQVLQTMLNDESIIIEYSHGTCLECSRIVSADYLRPLRNKHDYPIIYRGLYCKPCYYAPISDTDEDAN